MQPVYKVVIAEDESLILKNLVSIFEKEYPRFAVAGTAANGLEAIELVETLRPHLLLSDIRMPLADGLEVLRYIRRHELPTATVLLSGYDQFRYAQQALRYGACEYLLKPVNAAQLGQALREVEARCLAKSGEHEGFDLDSALVSGAQPIPGSDPCSCLLLMHAGNFAFAAQEASAGDGPPPGQVPDGLLRPGEQCWPGSADKGRYRYLLFCCDGPGRARAFARELFRRLNDGEPAWPVSVLYAMVSGAGGLPKAATGLLELMRNKSVLGAPLFCESGKTGHGASFQQLFALFSVLGEQLIRALALGNGDRARLTLREMAQLWQSSGCPASTALNLVRFLYMQAGKELKAPLPVNWQEQLSLAFTGARDWAGLCDALYPLFAALPPDHKKAVSSEEMMRMIDEYICTHYAEHITNQSLAKQYGFVPSYISKLFKEYKGLSPCDYLTRVRIDKAIGMITRSADRNVSNIAAAVGMSDASYFSRLFKQQTGLLPSEYRDHILREREQDGL